ncbi:MAG: C39 family peptidase [Thermomicrobiales bacterium]
MRRIVTRAFVAGGIALALCTPIATPAAFAQTASVEAWATLDATHPSPGCNVGVTVEVHSGGAANANANVSIVLSEDATGTMISSDSGETNDSGVAYLSYDTSGAVSGDKLWLELHVNDTYLGGKTIWTDGNSCALGATVIDLTGNAPSTSAATTSTSTSSDSSGSGTSADASSGPVMISNISAYQQQRPSSCEYASLSIATGALGNWISEYDFDSLVGWNDNPHWGYRGNINGAWGGTTDYGVYPEALVPALNQLGFNGEVSDGDNSTLMNSIDRGEPTLVWIGLRGDQSIPPTTSDGTTYQVTAGMHVVVAYGYDNGGVYASDPGAGKLRYYDWGTFDSIWGIMDNMALAVSR